MPHLLFPHPGVWVGLRCVFMAGFLCPHVPSMFISSIMWWRVWPEMFVTDFIWMTTSYWHRIGHIILPAGNKFTYCTVFKNYSRAKNLRLGLKSCTIIHLSVFFFVCFFFALTNVIVHLSSSQHFTSCSLHLSLQTVKYLFQWKIFFSCC